MAGRSRTFGFHAPHQKEIRMAEQPSAKRNFALLVTTTLVTLVVWNLPYIGWLLYPLTAFVTALHEIGHALACLITGGAVTGMTIVSDGHGHGGLTMCKGGIAFIYIQAGYLGTALFGCLLIYGSRCTRGAQMCLVNLGVLLLLAAVFLMTQTVVSGETAQGLWSMFWAVLIAGALIYAAAKLSPLNCQLFAMFLASVTALNALTDVFYLILLSAGLYPSRSFSDATIMADMTGLPAVVWSLLWGAASAGMLYFTVRKTYFGRDFRFGPIV
jgi:hypothetical protein